MDIKLQAGMLGNEMMTSVGTYKILVKCMHFILLKTFLNGKVFFFSFYICKALSWRKF